MQTTTKNILDYRSRTLLLSSSIAFSLSTFMFALVLMSLLAACGGGGGGGTSSGSGSGSGSNQTPINSPSIWYGYARDAQHTDLALTLAQGGVAAQNLGQIAWEMPIDLTFATNTLPIHYGSPMITSKNTVMVPVKTTLTGGFKVQAVQGSTGQVMWSAPSDYIFPPLGANVWTPSFGATFTAINRMVMPGSGGKILYVDNPDGNTATVSSIIFYGANAYAASPSAFDSSVFINTPIATDPNGNIYFGYTVTGANPANLVSGFVRIGANGTITTAAANTAVNQTGAVTTATNATPGLSNDLSTLYVVVRTVPGSGNGTGYLVALDSTTLVTKSMVQLNDPFAGTPATVSDDSTASPMIGPDGDVYYGVLESVQGAHDFRGWLLHFDATLATVKIPGSFGWDDTPSLVPASLVPSYKGTSAYLLLTKYNNYAELIGDGKNKMAILDPNATEPDPYDSNPVMNEVMTVLGPTADPAFPAKPGAVKEWCVNSAVVDPISGSVLMNSEDGFLYRWDLTSGQLSQKIWQDNGYGQAYTPTALGPDGTIYSINAGSLIAIVN